MTTNPLIAEVSLLDILLEIYRKPCSLQANFVREFSHSFARLASCGLITSELPPSSGSFGNHWRVTLKGLRVIELTEDREDACVS